MPPMLPLSYRRPDLADAERRTDELLATMRARRSVRHFSPDPVPARLVERCIEIAAQAPSGANKQPWTFALVGDPETKRRIRAAAEEEERAFYEQRAPARWIEDLEPLGTNADKPFLEEAPWLIVVFAQRTPADPEGRHYYVAESVGIASGFLIAAIHLAGLVTLTHTPSPMGFLSEILGRPANERPFLLLPVGYPAERCEVPDIGRKALDEVIVRR